MAGQNFKYLLINTADNSVQGTDDESEIDEFCKDEDYIVIKNENGVLTQIDEDGNEIWIGEL